jgi:hypothetical protein
LSTEAALVMFPASFLRWNMATNRQPPLPDAQAMPEIARAMRQIDRLIPLVGAPVQVTTTQQVPNELHNWELVGPAMLFSATSCLVSIRWLAESRTPRRDEDASVLVRRLYEHAVDFAWIAVNATVNAPKWVADDFRHRLEADDDLKLIDASTLTPEVRAEYQAFIDKHGRMPGVAKRANQADQHWSTRLEGHGTFPTVAGQTQTGLWSLRKMYAAVYRFASANVHPSPQSLRDFVWPGGASNRFWIGNDTDHQIDRYAYTYAPLVFATMLLMAEKVLGRPNGDDVRAAFQE